MGRKWVLGMVGVVAALALGGIGFAQFTSTATITGNATAGTFGPLTWDHGATGTPSPVDSQACSTSGSGSTLTLSASNFAPGDTCSVKDALTNHGTLPGLLTESYTLTGSSANCPGTEWSYSDTITATPSPGLPISAGGSITDTIVIGLSASAGNPCMNQSVSLSAVVTGTAS